MLRYYRIYFYVLTFCPLILAANIIDPDAKFFYYFAYGSNLCIERIHHHMPSAIKVDAAALKHYRLDFGNWSKVWCGPVANIVPDANATTYGVLWKIDTVDLPALNRQEGVPTCYDPINVPVILLSNGTTIIAHTYTLINTHKEDAYDQRPTKTLMKVMMKGAQEAGLPSDYIQFLKDFEYSNIVLPEREQKFGVEHIQLIERESNKNNPIKEIDLMDLKELELINPHFAEC